MSYIPLREKSSIKVVNMRDSYKYYREKNKNGVKNIHLYCKIIDGFLAFMMKKVLDGFIVQLSNGNSLGTIGIRGIRPKVKVWDDTGILSGATIDWGSTNKMWKENPKARAERVYVYYSNYHTNGYKYNFVWWREGMLIANKSLYTLTICKGARRKLRGLLEKGKEYLTH